MIGPVDSKCAKALCKAQRNVALPAGADEVGIFFNLSMNRVHYFPKRSAIYYTDSELIPVADIISSVLEGVGAKLEIEQLYLDAIGIFKSLKRVTLSDKAASAVLVALRMEGVKVTISE